MRDLWIARGVRGLYWLAVAAAALALLPVARVATDGEAALAWLTLLGVAVVGLDGIIKGQLQGVKRRLNARGRDAWQAAANRLLLDRFGGDQIDYAVRLVGVNDGALVALHCQPADRRGRARCEIVVQMDRPILDVPSWRRLRGREIGPGAVPVELGDPVLDGAVAVEGVGRGDTTALRRELARDAVRGPLMAVLHRWPESEVTPEAVVVRCTIQRVPPRGSLGTPPGIEALEEAVRDAAALARALSMSG